MHHFSMAERGGEHQGCLMLFVERDVVGCFVAEGQEELHCGQVAESAG